MSKLLINPYKVGPPVMGTDFYGRSELLSKVQKALQTSNVVLLQGQRRIGKTSFLKQLSVFLKSAEGMQAFQAPLVPVIFDIQRYVQDTLPQFQWHLAEAIARELQLTAPSLPEWEANHALFQDVWLPQVYEKLGDQDLVILVDEFDNLEGQAASQAMQTLIPFLGQLVSSETRLKWVLTLGRQTGKLPIQYDPIVSVAISFRISFLSPEETRKLIELPSNQLLKYQPEAIERIYQLTSGQPHLTQALGSEIFQQVVLEEEREIVEISDVDSVVSRTLETYNGAISSIIKVPPIEERVLVAVAQLTNNNRSTNRDEIIKLLLERDIQLEIDELTRALNSLLSWDLFKGTLQEIRVYVELVRIWISKNLSLEVSRETKLDIKAALAQSRFEFAEKARHEGQFDLAIKDYEEALHYVPNHIGALKGLAEANRLIGNIAGRRDVLETLHLYEPGALNDLVESLIRLAREAEKSGDFDSAITQYRRLITLQSREQWKVKLYELMSKELIRQMQEAEILLGYKTENLRSSSDDEERSHFGNLNRIRVKLITFNAEIKTLASSLQSSTISGKVIEELDSLEQERANIIIAKCYVQEFVLFKELSQTSHIYVDDFQGEGIKTHEEIELSVEPFSKEFESSIFRKLRFLERRKVPLNRKERTAFILLLVAKIQNLEFYFTAVLFSLFGLSSIWAIIGSFGVVQSLNLLLIILVSIAVNLLIANIARSIIEFLIYLCDKSLNLLIRKLSLRGEMSHSNSKIRVNRSVLSLNIFGTIRLLFSDISTTIKVITDKVSRFRKTLRFLSPSYLFYIVCRFLVKRLYKDSEKLNGSSN